MATESADVKAVGSANGHALGEQENVDGYRLPNEHDNKGTVALKPLLQTVVQREPSFKCDPSSQAGFPAFVMPVGARHEHALQRPVGAAVNSPAHFTVAPAGA
jgi:hypothetical protein